MVSVIHPSSTQHFGPYNPYVPSSSDIMNYTTPVQAYTGQQHLTWPSSSLLRTFYRPQNPFNLQNRTRYDVKDYSKPLFVDCSIEYELPNAPKVPKNSEPILMIHPSYMKPRIYLKAKSVNRSNETKNLAPKVSTAKKNAKRSYKQGPGAGEFPGAYQALLPQSQVPYTSCYCCQCHPLAAASKRSRQMYFEQLKQQQHPFFQYPQGLNFRYGPNWT
ncbi:uncharacterized protein [Lepeophtheirus salmonis]|uniref:uncharacterized protein n=1 Tax=Lepeophtheirus salmonis TaxID=72036 RepID=UPI001AEAF9AB|nr:centrosomal and chromosomal factor-like [Lepeophtheirus salmonis]